MPLAVALYHNNVDDEDELEFRKGDILTVLIENPHGLYGWWLCELNGKCGLCPGNRLKLITNKIQDRTRLSTASMYDDLSNDYDVPISVASSTSSSNHHDYDIPHRSDFISPMHHTSKQPTDHSSPESSSRSSGIYSSIDLRLSDLSSSSLSSEFHTSTQTKIFNNCHSLTSIDADQWQSSFRKLSIRSSILDKYHRLLNHKLNENDARAFIEECRYFLQEYGYLFDRQTYKTFKQTLLFELQQLKIDSSQRYYFVAKEMMLLIKTMVDLRLNEKQKNPSSISMDVLKKLNLEPIEENQNENETKKIPTSMSTTHLYGHLKQNSYRPSPMTTSRTYHSNFLLESSTPKVDNYDYIDDDYSATSTLLNDPLIKCYHRHIREHITAMFTRHSYLCQSNLSLTKINSISGLINEGKTLIVAGQKLIFILETLHEQIQTSLIPLSKQLSEALGSLLRLLKQLSHDSCTEKNELLNQFQYQTRVIMNIAKKIKRHCTAN